MVALVFTISGKWKGKKHAGVHGKICEPSLEQAQGFSLYSIS